MRKIAIVLVWLLTLDSLCAQERPVYPQLRHRWAYRVFATQLDPLLEQKTGVHTKPLVDLVRKRLRGAALQLHAGRSINPKLSLDEFLLNERNLRKFGGGTDVTNCFVVELDVQRLELLKIIYNIKVSVVDLDDGGKILPLWGGGRSGVSTRGSARADLTRDLDLVMDDFLTDWRLANRGQR